MPRATRNRAERLRLAVDALPRRSRLAMLDGITANRIIVGAYADSRSGGICPMLAAHRNGGRTSLASFARAWDHFTNARRPRLATRREIRALRSYLEMSLLRDETGADSLSDLARVLRAERDDAAAQRDPSAPAAPSAPRTTAVTPDETAAPIRIRRRGSTADRHHPGALRSRWSWLRPTRRYDHFRDLVAAAEEQLAERDDAGLVGDETAHPR